MPSDPEQTLELTITGKKAELSRDTALTRSAGGKSFNKKANI